MRPAPAFAGLKAYPFTRLTEAKRRLAEAGVEVIDFGVGEPREETPAFLRRALADAIPAVSGYPLAEGLPELRAAVAGWVSRRFGVALDPDREVVPTYGSKEAIFSLANVLDGDLVAVTTPGYPVPARGGLLHGKAVLELGLHAGAGFLPDLDAVPPATWSRVAVLWINSPNNPTTAVAPLALLEQAAALAREHDFVLAADEAYSELYFGDDAPASALQVADRRNVVAFNTLSKRSAMAGWRCGFAAGDADVIGALKRYRPNVGTAPQEFVQRAAVAAWEDETHVEAMRETYRRKREVMLEAVEAAGLRHVGGEATMFLWLEGGEPFAERLLERGVVLTPGSYLGPGGEGYARLALVPPLEACRRAAGIIRSL